jgi:hypothetical protein
MQDIDLVVRLYQEGNANPTAAQIGVEPKRLRAIVKALETAGYDACVISQDAYQRPFFGQPPPDFGYARLYLPLEGRQPAGIHFSTGINDPIMIVLAREEMMAARKGLLRAVAKADEVVTVINDRITIGRMSPLGETPMTANAT